jgi:hypothetical protein
MKRSFYFIGISAVLCVCFAVIRSHWTVIQDDIEAEPVLAQPDLVDSPHQMPYPLEEGVVEPSERTRVDVWGAQLELACELATRDPASALAWVEQLQAREDRETALKQVCLQVTQRDPAMAMDAAWRLQLGKWGDADQTIVLEKLASQWAASDLRAALAWMQELPVMEDTRRDHIVKGIASAIASAEPETAARLVAERMTADSAQFHAALDVLSKWSTNDMAAAKAWVDAFPDGLREMAQARLARLLEAPKL